MLNSSSFQKHFSVTFDFFLVVVKSSVFNFNIFLICSHQSHWGKWAELKFPWVSASDDFWIIKCNSVGIRYCSGRKIPRKQNHPDGFPAEPAQISLYHICKCFWIWEDLLSCVPRRRHRTNLGLKAGLSCPHRLASKAVCPSKSRSAGKCDAEVQVSLPGTHVDIYAVHLIVLPDQRNPWPSRISEHSV